MPKRAYPAYFVMIISLNSCFGEPSVFRDIELPNPSSDFGTAVHLTDYIERGKLEEAREAAAVDLAAFIRDRRITNDPPRLSYTGFITVNKTCDSNLFFWFIPAKIQPDRAPVMMWLQGGPGSPSTFGLFVEHGPWVVDEDMSLHLREYEWSAQHSMLYVDQPVGTGFSYTGKDECYATNQEDIAKDLYSFLAQFFIIFHDFKKQEFYVTGESYAGKYVPAITRKIISENERAETKINLAGMAIGNGFSDPMNMRNLGKLLYQIGMIGKKEHQHFREVQQDAKYFIEKGEWHIAAELFNDLIIDEYFLGKSYFKNVTGSANPCNLLQFAEPEEFGFFIKFLNLPRVRKLIHVGDKVFHEPSKVITFMFKDIMKSVKPWVEDILNSGYKVLFYNGQIDIIVGYPMTENFVRKLRWKHATGFDAASRSQWKILSEIAGYAQEFKNLAVVLVRNAGHMVPYDQPLLAVDMISRFTSGKPFSTTRNN